MGKGSGTVETFNSGNKAANTTGTSYANTTTGTAMGYPPNTGGKVGPSMSTPFNTTTGADMRNSPTASILPPGSRMTMDMGPDGMSTTERDFLTKYGKPFSEMTPEEQNAVLNPAPMGSPNPPAPNTITPPMSGATTDPLTGTTPTVDPATGTNTNSSGFNVNTAAASGLEKAMDATTSAIYDPLNVGAFNNPYQQEVVDNTQADIERQRQMTMNNLGSAASAAGAFGGSRHGVAEGVTNAEYGRVAGDVLGNLRMQGYNNAMSNAMADRDFRLGAANQLGGMADQAFNTGRTINQDLFAQGLVQQGLQQALIDAAKGDFANYADSPNASLTAPLAALGAAPKPTSQTSSEDPGILNILGAIKYLSGGKTALPFF